MHFSGTQLQGSIKSNLLSDTRVVGPHVSNIFSLTLEGMLNQPFTTSLLVIISAHHYFFFGPKIDLANCMIRPPKMAVLLLSVHPLLDQSLPHCTYSPD